MNAKSSERHGRRRFLRGAGALGAVSLALPFLSSDSRGASSDFPKRLLVFFSGNGTIYENWRPQSQAGQITQLSPILAPLEAHLENIAVLDGIEITVARSEHQPSGAFHGHERGLGGILTGQNLNLGEMEAGSWYANGISVDQHLANSLSVPGSLHSLQVGIATKRSSSGWYNRDTMTYAGANDPRFAQTDGGKLFTTIFGETPGDGGAHERLRARRQSVLDYLSSDLRRVSAKLSLADRARLQQHEATFRTLEVEISQPAPTCSQLERPGIDRWQDEARIEEIANFQIKQTVQALACDRTQVATMQFGNGLGALSLRAAGYTDSWHAVSHEGDGNQDARQKLTEMNTFIAGRFAQLLSEMSAIEEGEGTLLDHSLLLWVNELGKGNEHTYDKAPIVLAGGLHNTIKTGGRHFTFDDRPNNDLLVSICQAFGLQDEQFGKPGLSSGSIAELFV